MFKEKVCLNDSVGMYLKMFTSYKTANVDLYTFAKTLGEGTSIDLCLKNDKGMKIDTYVLSELDYKNRLFEDVASYHIEVTLCSDAENLQLFKEICDENYRITSTEIMFDGFYSIECKGTPKIMEEIYKHIIGLSFKINLKN